MRSHARAERTVRSLITFPLSPHFFGFFFIAARLFQTHPSMDPQINSPPGSVPAGTVATLVEIYESGSETHLESPRPVRPAALPSSVSARQGSPDAHAAAADSGGFSTPAVTATAMAATPARPFVAPTPAASPPSAPRPSRDLTGRLTLPLSIPVATELVRKPIPAHGLDSVGRLCKQALGCQEQHVSAAIQALISRASCSTSCDSALAALTQTMRQTDDAMAEMMLGLGALDQVMWEAAKPASVDQASAAPLRQGGWVRLRPEYRSLQQHHARTKTPLLFARGSVAKMRALDADALGTHPVATTSSSSSSAAPSRPVLLTPHHSSLNQPPRLRPLDASAASRTSAVPSQLRSSPLTPTVVVSHSHQAPPMFSPETPQHQNQPRGAVPPPSL